MRRFLVSFIVLFAFTAYAAVAQENTLRLVTHDSFNVSQSVLDEFQTATGLTVDIVRLGDAGTMVNQSILSKENPLGDVMFGVDNTFLSRALDADLFVPYSSPLMKAIDPAFDLDSEHRVTPIDYGDVCLNYDVAYFANHALALPDSLKTLSEPSYKGLLAVENPATSSPGLAFLLATVAAFGEEGDYTYQDYWRDLVANDVYVSDSWTDAYYGQFSGSAGSDGDRPLVISYASSPPAEVFFADPPVSSAPTGSIVAPGTCFRQIEFAGVLANGANPEGAQQLIDFLLGKAFQEDMPLQMFVFPVNPEAQLPDVFTQYAAIPDEPVTLSAADIDANRDRWIQAWTEIVLH